MQKKNNMFISYSKFKQKKKNTRYILVTYDITLNKIVSTN